MCASGGCLIGLLVMGWLVELLVYMLGGGFSCVGIGLFLHIAVVIWHKQSILFL